MPSDKKFGYMFAAIFGLLGIYSIWKGLGFEIYAATVCVVLLFVASVFPFLLHPFNALWFRLGNLLHKLISPVVMLLLFVSVIVPVALTMKLLRRDPLNRRIDPARHSYWERRPVWDVTVERMKQQF